MQGNRLTAACAAVLLGCAVEPVAHATDGYFQPGYSVRSVGMGGVGIALPQDALAAATNPAGMALLGDRIDVGLTLFRPVRGATINGTAFSANHQSLFTIPEFGINYLPRPDLSLGVSVYGNGGMNTSYGSSIGSSVGGRLFQAGAGVDLQQMFIAPSVAWRVTPTQTLGLAVDLVHQTFRANGLGNFQGYSVNGQGFGNPGHDGSDGIGVRLGWIARLGSALSVGATYQPRIHMGSLGAYSGLFAGGGNLDIPANYGIGLAWQEGAWSLGADVERIEYSGVPSVGNSIAELNSGHLFGSAEGPGFGWSNVTVVKLGAQYRVDPRLLLRAGYNHATNPVSGSQVVLNTLAPGIVQDHLSVGLSYALSRRWEISGDYVHAFSNSVSGSMRSFGVQSETLSMYQDSLGVGLSYRY